MENCKTISLVEHCIIVIMSFVQLYILGILIFNVEILNPIANAIKNYSITDVFFQIEHSNETPIVNDLITIVDISDVKERSEIAKILYEIDLQNPLALGLDVIFEGTRFDSIGNEVLTTSILAIKDKAVFANKLTEYSFESGEFRNDVKSFFANDLSIKEGFVNLTDDLQGKCIRDFVTTETLKGKRMLSFPAELLLQVDKNFPLNISDPILINYSNVDFPVITPDEIIEKSEYIDGRIILIGSLNEEGDMHNTPLGKSPGIIIQAYTLLTLVEHQNTTYIPIWCNWIIAFFLCLLFEILFHNIRCYIDKRKNNVIMLFLKESNITNVVYLFLWLILLYWILYYSFINYNLIFNGTIMLASITLVGESRNIYHALIVSLSIKFKWKFLKCSFFYKDKIIQP